MTRLRYNGTTATLGAALTTGATAITFAEALTYAGGNVATITGSDYIPLSILDADGNVTEIVYLTAYTSGATAGTITRGQEGTAGVTHAAGDKVVHSPTVLDVQGGNLTVYSAYTPVLTAVTTNPNLGSTGIAQGRFCRIGVGAGSHIEGDAYLKFSGSGVSNGNGNYRISLPVAADTSVTARPVGYGWSFVSGAGLTNFVALLQTATTVRLFRTISGGWEFNHGIPNVWQANDELAMHFNYEAAA